MHISNSRLWQSTVYYNKRKLTLKSYKADENYVILSSLYLLLYHKKLQLYESQRDYHD